jgi:ligand-binding sensor domain-containing protein/signal transduction histidine kinase/DNA-binding response OmpR family regulator
MKYKLLIFLLFISGSVLSQNNNYRFKNISTVDGLSQSSVIAIHQDAFGQMWFGTRDGLNKYDGSKFTIYRNEPNNSSSISNNDILSIEEDRTGKIWVGTYNGLNCYDPKTNTFKRYFHTNDNTSISNNAVWTVKEIGDEIWIGTSKGLTIFDEKTHKFRSVFHDNQNSLSLPSNYVLSVFYSKKKQIWIGTANGLCKLISRTNNVFKFKTLNHNENSENIYVQSIAEDGDDNLWIASKNRGLLQYEYSTQKLIHYNEKYKQINLDVRSISIDHEGAIWVGEYDGLCVLHKDGTIYKINNNTNNNRIDKVKSVYTDKKGSVWIGCYYKGINLWDISNVNFTNFRQNSLKNRLSFDVVSSIIGDKQNNIYFGTEGGGITVYNRKTKQNYYLNSSTFEANLKDNIKSMFYADDGILWIGTFSKGLLAYNTFNKTFLQNKISKELKNYLSGTGVYSIKDGGKGILWLGTFGKGLIKYNIVTGTFQNIGNGNYSDYFLTNNRIRTILVDQKNTLWIGTQSGLNCINLNEAENNNYQIKHYFFDNNVLSGDDILSLFEDSQGRIWTGTKAKGLFLWENRNFKKINLDIGNTTITSIHSIVEDADNNLWLSTNQGIIKYNIQKNTLIAYDQKDGLVSNEYNDNACLVIDSHDFYFGGPSGVTYFNAKKIALNDYSPQVLITNLKIKNESENNNQKIADRNILFSQSISLNHDNANFAIQFAIPNFIRPKNNQYAYRLNGLEKNWTVTNNAEANYAIQNPGTYVFEVRGANNDGIWNKKTTSIEIVILPAPWRSWWAYTLYLLALSAALYGLSWILKSKAKLKRELELEHLEAQRIKENNLAKLEFFTNISHEFRTPLTLILGPLQQILINYNGNNAMYKKLLVIESSANHLLNLINKLMDFRKLESKQFNLESAEGNLVKFIKEIYLSFIEYAKDGDYVYLFESAEEDIQVYFDRNKLEHVFYNLISNAFRYTPKGGTIKIRILKNEKDVIIEVEDNGIGIDKQYIDKIFDLFFEIPTQNEAQKNYNQSTGIGLAIVKNIVNLHKGVIQVANKTSNGVVFKVSLPSGCQHLSDDEIVKDFKISDDISKYTSQLPSNEQFESNDLEDLVFHDDKHTILLVEDHKVLRSFIKKILKKEYNIIEADNGKTALKKALKYVPNLIISDVMMPEMVGTELCAAIKENLKTSHIPVILLTSRTSLIYKYEGLESGADDYISKPFNLIEFKLRVKNLLESTERLRQKFSSNDHFMPSEISVSSLDEELLKKAFKIVENNISNEQFDIPFFCSELGVSRTMLFLKIKAWTNFTPNEFIHEIRLKRAASLLEQNKINISQVSYKVGFNNPKYFSKCFQKKYGETPSQFAEKFAKQDLN